MLNRRTLLATAATATATAAMGAAKMGDLPAAPGNTVAAPDVKDVKMDPYNMTAAQKLRHPGTRFAKLADNSYQDFCDGMRRLAGRLNRQPEHGAHTAKFLRAQGLSAIDDTEMSLEEAYNTMLKDPVYAASVRVARSVQLLMWERSMRAFHADGDKWLAELAKTDKSGPGTLELNPDLVYPDYTRHEIHAQPGGYVGDPFAGFVYNYALDVGFHYDQHGDNDHDEMYLRMAQALTLPANGEVHRILDLGCGTGQYTTSLKERFPQAEVWGLEVGAPMVRYAHYRAVHMNTDVNFAHRLAEDTKFKDGHFDIVTDHIMFHEVSDEGAKNIVAEAYRVLRPGGIFHHLDLSSDGELTVPPRTLPGKSGRWVNHRHNLEVWTPDYEELNFPNVLRAAGFKVDLVAPLARPSYPGVIAIKPA